MYWIFLILFIIAVLTPDIVRGPVYFLVEERVEEIFVFIMGAIAFFVFIQNERKINQQKKQKEKDEKRIHQTVKDLVESYSYIGEVNRKMDIVMNIALGLSDGSSLNKKKELEIYKSIVSAANFLMKADCTCLRFMDVTSGKTEKEFVLEEKEETVKNDALMMMEENVNVKKDGSCIIISSSQKINSIKSYLIICGYDPEEESSPKNIEILKVFTSQALFLYSYTQIKPNY
jgi:hypothetical protein